MNYCTECGSKMGWCQHTRPAYVGDRPRYRTIWDTLGEVCVAVSMGPADQSLRQRRWRFARYVFFVVTACVLFL